MKSFALLLVPATTFAASINLPRDLTPASSLPSGWQYAGCSVDAVSPRSLSQASTISNTDNSADSCIAFCSSKGYNVAGTEYSSECYCGSALPTAADEASCNMPCSSDASQACGGPSRLSVYYNPSASTSMNPGVAGWVSGGCIKDDVQDRTLPDLKQVDGPMAVAKCVAACQASGYVLGGVEYGGECWCGNSANLKPTNDPSQCYMPCAGNHSEFCGGPDALNVYYAPSTTPPPSGNCLPLRADGYGLLQNGGFEDGFNGWVANVVSGEFQPALDKADQYEGCQAAKITPTSPPTSGSRQISISQTLSNLTPGASYTFTGYQGRLAASLNDDSPVIAVIVGAQRLGEITACSGSGCELSVADGAAAYTKHTVPFTYEGQGPVADLAFVVTYTSADTEKGNPPLLFDGFNLVEDEAAPSADRL